MNKQDLVDVVVEALESESEMRRQLKWKTFLFFSGEKQEKKHLNE